MHNNILYTCGYIVVDTFLHKKDTLGKGGGGVGAGVRGYVRLRGVFTPKNHFFLFLFFW